MKRNIMTSDERIIYQGFLQDGYISEREGNYEIAMSRYYLAKEIAEETNEKPTDALKGIDRCQQALLQKNDMTF